jgi:hypothetical protein
MCGYLKISQKLIIKLIEKFKHKVVNIIRNKVIVHTLNFIVTMKKLFDIKIGYTIFITYK